MIRVFAAVHVVLESVVIENCGLPTRNEVRCYLLLALLCGVCVRVHVINVSLKQVSHIDDNLGAISLSKELVLKVKQFLQCIEGVVRNKQLETTIDLF